MCTEDSDKKMFSWEDWELYQAGIRYEIREQWWKGASAGWLWGILFTSAVHWVIHLVGRL